LTATFGVSRAVYQVNGSCGLEREDSTHYISCCISLIKSLQTITFVYYPDICLGRLKKPYLTSVMIAYLWLGIFSLGFSSTVQWAKEIRTGSHVISCCTWKLTKKEKIFFHLFDLIILNIYVLLTLKTKT
jgi:hypothetical protein